jgi:hypothetical protein
VHVTPLDADGFGLYIQELEKLISYNGTPTAVWRRTGEICLAGEEFCRLTEFSKSDLLSKKTFIYELFEKQSWVHGGDTWHCMLKKLLLTSRPSAESLTILKSSLNTHSKTQRKTSSGNVSW